MYTVMDDQVAEQVCPAGHKPFHKGIMAALSPARHNVQVIVQQIPDHHRDISRIVLAISIHCYNEILSRGLKTAVQCGCLAIVLPKLDICQRMEGAADLISFICGSVIDEDDLVR